VGTVEASDKEAPNASVELIRIVLQVCHLK
jgi:hypothetical protein